MTTSEPTDPARNLLNALIESGFDQPIDDSVELAIIQRHMDIYATEHEKELREQSKASFQHAEVKDKERLDFLEQANGHVYLTHMGGANINDLFLTGKDEIRAESLRHAIDAAMKGTKCS